MPLPRPWASGSGTTSPGSVDAGPELDWGRGGLELGGLRRFGRSGRPQRSGPRHLNSRSFGAAGAAPEVRVGAGPEGTPDSWKEQSSPAPSQRSLVALQGPRTLHVQVTCPTECPLLASLAS